MLTVETLMGLPSMQQAEIIAGKGGILNTIRWSHIIELHDVSKWIRDDTLVIVTGVAFADLESDLRHVLMAAIENQAAAMLVSISQYIREIPQSVIEMANDNKFPFIQIPGECSFMDITYEVARKILLDDDTGMEGLYDTELYEQIRTQFDQSKITENEVLADTLRTYIEEGGNATSSSRRMYIHLNTMKYRLAKIEEALGCNLRDEQVRLILKVLLRE